MDLHPGHIHFFAPSGLRVEAAQGMTTSDSWLKQPELSGNVTMESRATRANLCYKLHINTFYRRKDGDLARV